ncbi:alkylation response protein AidB-like acyl-CoA dehydrogenase [Hymenobacter luteus]|uniref:Alkylation response protein AidB-like acyl-CoA dehydrogenase n=2 Tax=Hymenobacter TaxID=89966 RepID=A0A7W9T5B4_9BACT|nr:MULTISPECIES: acyl-CoA dehydrogenase family protein [Hymenobacter]MBB4602788.1 alkylation response protein AidB-like acyl-CoA dehydrogenase [Hymenobacter latericoloratus]MBB6060679.1 alkylation response protein AidB-like acyl-CoA dehydrogenase [Hymenobacter luteus]
MTVSATPALAANPLTTPQAAEEAAAALAPRLFAHAPHSDQEGGFPTEEFDWLREVGLLAAPLPPALGGSGLSEAACTAYLLSTLRHIGRGNLAVGRVYEGHVNALQLIARFGRPDQQARWAADARSGHLFGVWNTEAQDGVKLEPLPNGRYRLRGSKTFGSGAGHLTRPLLTGALPDGGWQMLVLPADALPPEYNKTFWRPLGMRASASFRVDFTGLELDAQELLGAPGDYYRQPWFSGGAIRFAAVQLGGAEAIFDETRRFLRKLGRTDDPYQRHRLGEMSLLVASGQHWLRAAADFVAHSTAELTGPEAAEATVAHANLVRSAIEELCLRLMPLAERCVGARGLLRPEPFERLHRDLTHYLRQPAPDAALADAGRYALQQEQPAYRLWQG